MARLSNPFAFTRGPVTILTTIIYIAVLAAVITVHYQLPTLPTSPTPIHGVNLTEAWNDLQFLSAEHHPYNSRANDVIHTWLLHRIRSILSENKAAPPEAYVFDDLTSNLTFSSGNTISASGGTSVYFEGTNIVVYIRGEKDDKNEWWTTGKAQPTRRNGVLVNAHYDSVSSGFGATDDGVGVVSVLQLIRYFTTAEHRPQNGLVLLLNNGEEDFLNGANVFSQHFMSQFVSGFLNLEGAGAGGRAALFRSTDQEMTMAYARSPYPFGSVVSGDAFERGLVRSQTDYVVFNGKLGMRGLDVAFIEPRARYHTNQDDSRHTGKQAVWHMLSAATSTTQELVNSNPAASQNLDLKPGHPAVWFDLFGEAFAVMRAHTFFALNVTVLVVGPVLLLATMALLYRADKFYFFTARYVIHTPEGEESLPVGGWKGFFRFPLILVFSCAAPIALAFWLFKENPFIAHSSEWPVWIVMTSAFIFVAWFLSRAVGAIRPSALTRAYALSWMCGIWWALLIAATVAEQQFHLVGGYFVLLYSASLFVATFCAFLELFSLPKKSKFCASKLGYESSAASSRSASRSLAHPEGVASASHEEANDNADTTERSALLPDRGRSAYRKYIASRDDTSHDRSSKQADVQSYAEQDWSKTMWSSLWIFELLLIGPINIIILGQLGLYLVAALHQTGSDGSSMFTVYIGMAVLTIFIFMPMLPLLHRFTWHLPMLLLLALVASLIYTVLAFPFSSQNRLKLFFVQEVDLNNGTNSVSLTGPPIYVQDAIYSIPSAAGQDLNCVKATRPGDLQTCSWVGLVPDVLGVQRVMAVEASYKSWLDYNVTLTSNGTDTRSAQFVISGRNTRACKLQFDTNVLDFTVHGQGPVDKRFVPVPEGGSKEIRLWSRTWDRAWTVDVSWPHDSDHKEKGSQLTGRAVCLWSDVNQRGTIPAYDEALHFVPDWVAMTKSADGLVEGFKRFAI